MAINLAGLSQAAVKITGFLVIIVLTFVIGRVFGKLVERILAEFEINKIVRKTGKKWRVEEMTGITIRFGCYITGIIIALNYLGLGRETLSIIGWMVIITLGIFLLLALMDFVPNFLYGLGVRLAAGENIELDDIKGRIINRGSTGIMVEASNNENIFIPYSWLNKLLRKH